MSLSTLPSSLTLSTSSLPSISHDPFPSDKQIENSVTLTLSQHERIKKKLEKETDPNKRLHLLSIICLQQLSNILSSVQEKAKLQDKIIELIRSENFPVNEEILDYLILDPLWPTKIKELPKSWETDVSGIHKYVALLLHPDLNNIRTDLNTISEKRITLQIKASLKNKKLKKQLKPLESDEKKIDFLAEACSRDLFLSQEKNLEPLLVSLPTKRFSKQEIAAKKLPGGRNMLKELLSNNTNRLTYGEMAPALLSLFFKEEKKTLTATFKTFLLSDKGIFKKFNISPSQG